MLESKESSAAGLGRGGVFVRLLPRVQLSRNGSPVC